MLIVVAVFFVICAYRWGDWKNWYHYYPTMLFFGFGDLAYSCLFIRKMLWQYHSPIFPLIPHILLSFFWIFAIFVPTILLFLPRFPKKTFSRILYILLWAALYIIIEWLLGMLGYFEYSNSWSLLHSIVFDCLVFPLLYLHYKKPIPAWAFMFIGAIIALVLFKVPLLNK
jgi:hypothetical protein